MIELVGVVEEIRTFGVFEARVSEAEEELEEGRKESRGSGGSSKGE